MMPLKPHPTDSDKMVYESRKYELPKREWIGLTKMELIKCGVFPWGNSYRLYEAIEDKLKEKNT